MNDKKGFTLVEILVVIAIIGLITAIAIPSIMTLSRKMKERGFDSKIESIEQAAVNFVQDNANKIKDKYQGSDKFICNEDDTDCKYEFTISVKDLVDQGAYKSEKSDKTSCEVTNPYDGNHCLDCALIDIELDDEYKTVTAKVRRDDDEDKYLVKDKTCPASFNYELEYVDFTVTAENRSWVGFTGEENENLVIPETFTRDGIRYRVVAIGYGAFTYTSLYNVTLPDSITSISYNSFISCNNLISITVDTNNKNYKDIDGVLFNKNTTAIIKYPSKKSGTNYNIPSTVTTIADFAFDSARLTQIVIPNTVTSIGSAAFRYCPISTITIPESVTYISDRTFLLCNNLISITVDTNNKNYKDIDGVLFNKNTTAIIRYPSKKPGTNYNIPSTVTDINDCTFEDCQNLTTITIPNGVTSIGYAAFYDCDNLSSIIIPDGVTSIEDMVFFHCINLTTIIIPNGVTSIGDNAFKYCFNLSSIIIPDGVTSIGDSAFYWCSSLTSVIYNHTNYTSISAFTNAFLPNKIGSYVFYYTKLTA